MTFTENGDIVNGENGYIWFRDVDTIRLTNYNYIHSSFYIYFDPYTLYWRNKHLKWLKANVRERLNVTEIKTDKNYEYIDPTYIEECFVDLDVSVEKCNFGFKSAKVTSKIRPGTFSVDTLLKLNSDERDFIMEIDNAIQKIKIEHPSFNYYILLGEGETFKDGVKISVNLNRDFRK